MKSVLMACLAISLFPVLAQADYIFANCQGDSVRFTVGSFGYFEDPTGQYLHINARVIGSCDEALRINPTGFPYPPHMTQAVFGLTLPAFNEDRYVSYSLFREDAEGNVFPAYASGDLLSHTFEACPEDALFARGRIRRSGTEYYIEVCPDHCWIPYDLDFSFAEPGWEVYVDTDSVVNVFGEAFVDGMPGASRLEVSRVSLETDPDGCDAVAVEPLNWGSLKAIYR